MNRRALRIGSSLLALSNLASSPVARAATEDPCAEIKVARDALIGTKPGADPAANQYASYSVEQRLRWRFGRGSSHRIHNADAEYFALGHRIDPKNWKKEMGSLAKGRDSLPYCTVMLQYVKGHENGDVVDLADFDLGNSVMVHTWSEVSFSFNSHKSTKRKDARASIHFQSKSQPMMLSVRCENYKGDADLTYAVLEDALGAPVELVLTPDAKACEAATKADSLTAAAQAASLKSAPLVAPGLLKAAVSDSAAPKILSPTPAPADSVAKPAVPGKAPASAVPGL